MDVGAQVGAPAAGDWRSQLQPEARSRIVNKIMETLRKHLPVSVPEGLAELHKIAVRFEEKIYAAATSQSDYLRKISLKMLSMEGQNRTGTKENPVNGQAVQNQRPYYQASEDSTAQSDHTGAGNWQEEVHQMISVMKKQYLPELSDIHNKISLKIQYIDNHMPAQKISETYEKMKNFKLMLERTLQFLQIDTSAIQRSFKDKIPAYERQIVNIINSQRRKPVQAIQRSAGNVKRLRPGLNDDDIGS